MNVVLPNPDSPATMIVKAAPRLATILWRWLGSYDALSVPMPPDFVVQSTHIGNANRRRRLAHDCGWRSLCLRRRWGAARWGAVVSSCWRFRCCLVVPISPCLVTTHL